MHGNASIFPNEINFTEKNLKIEYTYRIYFRKSRIGIKMSKIWENVLKAVSGWNK